MDRRTTLMMMAALAPAVAQAELEKSGPMVPRTPSPVGIYFDRLGHLRIPPDVTALESAHISVLLASAMITQHSDLPGYVAQHNLQRFFVK